MSILVEGMKMPETCIQCPMQFGGFCYVQPPDIDEARVAPTVDEAWEQGKPKWCPLKEQKHGKWIVEADGMVTRCSECQSTITGLIFAKKWRYCHHCGAKMEVDDDRQ